LNKDDYVSKTKQEFDMLKSGADSLLFESVIANNDHFSKWVQNLKHIGLNCMAWQ